MRPKVPLEKDVERLLRDAMHRSRKSFKQTLNAALRAGLSSRTEPPRRKRFVVKARAMGLRPGIDPAGLNRLADGLEIDAFCSKQVSGATAIRRSRRRRTSPTRRNS